MDEFMLYSYEYRKLERLISEQNRLIQIFLPKYMSVSFLAEATGRSRQALRQYLHRNYIPDKDFFVKNGKIVVVKETAIQILARS